jgi:hypothetical protein
MAVAAVTNLYEVRGEAGTNNGDSDSDSESDDDLPTIEQLLYIKLCKEGFVTEDPSQEHTVGEVGGFEENSSVGGCGSAPGENSGMSRSEYPLCSLF